jgi:hypothetical protein
MPTLLLALKNPAVRSEEIAALEQEHQELSKALP